MSLLNLCTLCATIDIAETIATSLFLRHVAADYLPLTYLGEAAAVVVGSTIFAWSACRMQISRVVPLVCGSGAIACIGFHVMLTVFGHSVFAIVLFGFLVQVLAAIIELQFWTFAAEMFTSSEGKRVFGVIGAAGAAAEIGIGILFSALADQVGAVNFLFVAAGLFAIAFVAAQRLKQEFVSERGTGTSLAEEPTNIRDDLRRMWHSSLAMSTVVLACLGAFLFVVVDFQWKLAAQTRFGADEDSLASFIAIYYVFAGVGEFALQFFITGWMLRRFGVISARMCEPVYLMAASLAILAAPGAGISLLLATAARFFEVLRCSISGAARQLLYQPIAGDWRPRFKAMVEGIAIPVSSCISGLALMCLQGAFTARGLSLIVLGVSSAVAVCIWWTRRDYIAALTERIRRRADEPSQPMAISGEAWDVVAQWTHATDIRLIFRSLEMLSSAPAKVRCELSAPLIEHPLPTIRTKALEHLADPSCIRHVELIVGRLHDSDPSVRAQAIRTLAALQREEALDRLAPFLADQDATVRAACVAGLVAHCGLDGILAAAEQWKRMFVADDARMRAAAVEILEEQQTLQFQMHVRRLLHDPEVEVIRRASRAAGAMQSLELITPLIDNLRQPRLATCTVSALANYGAPVILRLQELLTDDNASTSTETRCAIAKVFQRLDCRETLPPLIRLLEDKHEAVRDAAATAIENLSHTQAKAIRGASVLERILESEIADYFQDVATWLDVEGAFPTSQISKAIAYRGDRRSKRILQLLAALQPRVNYRLLERGFRSRSRRERDCALELLDSVVAGRRKEELGVILDTRSMAQKLEWAHAHYSIERRSGADWLASLIADANEWVRAAACYQIGVERLEALAGQVIELAERDAGIVRETAIAALSRLIPRERLAELFPPSPVIARGTVVASTAPTWGDIFATSSTNG